MSRPQYTVKASFSAKGRDGWVHFQRSFILPFVPMIGLYLAVEECELPAIEFISYDYIKGFFNVGLKEQNFSCYTKEDLLQRYSCFEKLEDDY